MHGASLDDAGRHVVPDVDAATADDPHIARSSAARALAWLVGLPGPSAAGLLAVLLAGSWAMPHLAGGAGVFVPHGYYLPVLAAAIRFGRWGALAVALVAGLMAGPLTYQLVDVQLAQSTSEWLSRTVAFVLGGQAVAWLFGHALTSVQQDARLAREDRELARALRDGELSLRYQPIVDTVDGTLIGLESLVRWDHPDGERGPCAFVPTAERTGRIHEVGRFVLATACDQAAAWYREARVAGRHAPIVGINVSAQELATDAFVDHVHRALTVSGLPGRLLCVEVTEGALVVDLDGSARRLAALRELGVRIAVDDFGTGYSSLAYVHRFPLDVLKIDRSFVVDLEHSGPARELVGGVIGLCGRLGVTVVAEGIETAGQLAVMRDLDGELAQGYHLARPMRAEDLDGWLRATTPGQLPEPLTRRPAPRG